MIDSIFTVVIGCLIALAIRDFIEALISVCGTYKKSKDLYEIKDLRRDEDK